MYIGLNAISCLGIAMAHVYDTGITCIFLRAEFVLRIFNVHYYNTEM